MNELIIIPLQWVCIRIYGTCLSKLENSKLKAMHFDLNGFDI